jgi:hypothetical protein
MVAHSLSLVLAMLLLGHWVTAGVFTGLVALVIFGWHMKEPQEA